MRRFSPQGWHLQDAVLLISRLGPNCSMSAVPAHDRGQSQVRTETKMRNAFMIGAIFALATAVGPTASLAQGNAGAAAMHLSAAGSAASAAASAQAGSRT